MTVACPECGPSELDLLEVLEDERRRLKCEACDHEWLRGEAQGGHRSSALSDLLLGRARP